MGAVIIVHHQVHCACMDMLEVILAVLCKHGFMAASHQQQLLLNYSCFCSTAAGVFHWHQEQPA
jgi:hypothetical protein